MLHDGPTNSELVSTATTRLDNLQIFNIYPLGMVSTEHAPR